MILGLGASFFKNASSPMNLDKGRFQGGRADGIRTRNLSSPHKETGVFGVIRRVAAQSGTMSQPESNNGRGFAGVESTAQPGTDWHAMLSPGLPWVENVSENFGRWTFASGAGTSSPTIAVSLEAPCSNSRPGCRGWEGAFSSQAGRILIAHFDVAHAGPVLCENRWPRSRSG